jgi:hypothetical protein
MIVGNVQSVRMDLVYQDGTRFGISRLRLDSEDDNVYNLAISVNSIQDKEINRVMKRTVTEIMQI